MSVNENESIVTIKILCRFRVTLYKTTKQAKEKKRNDTSGVYIIKRFKKTKALELVFR